MCAGEGGKGCGLAGQMRVRGGPGVALDRRRCVGPLRQGGDARLHCMRREVGRQHSTRTASACRAHPPQAIIGCGHKLRPLLHLLCQLRRILLLLQNSGPVAEGHLVRALACRCRRVSGAAMRSQGTLSLSLSLSLTRRHTAAHSCVHTHAHTHHRHPPRWAGTPWAGCTTPRGPAA